LLLEAAEVAKKVTEAALDKQAADILMLDIRQSSYFADYFVICSAESGRQLQAICDEITKALKDEGVNVYRREGSAESGWALLDFGDVIAHVFAPSEREYYGLESLWTDATPVVRIL
jgi:ribosome-associated protein